LKILFVVILPTILIWTLGFPLLTYWQLRKRIKHLDDKDSIIKYGVFYIGLKDDRVYWEILVNNFRKAIVVIVTASITEKKAFM